MSVKLQTSRCSAILEPGKRYRVRYEIRTTRRPAIRQMIATFIEKDSMNRLVFHMRPVMPNPHAVSYLDVLEAQQVADTVNHHAPRKPSSIRKVAS